MKREHIVSQVLPGSIGEELYIEPGDVLLSINGQTILDVFDYQFLVAEGELTILVQKASGEEWELFIEKDDAEDLGLLFEESLMDNYRSCKNNCLFCFIDQLPKGLRETLYFKDDDARLSFLQGNYVTLTNMSESEIDRIIGYHLEPINISVHTTDKDLRVKMLHNRFAGEALKSIERLFTNHIKMNAQIVLCKGVNDGKHLEKTISDLAKYAPVLQSVSIVPVGLTRHREGLYPLEPFEKEDAREVIRLIEVWQEEMLARKGIHFVHGGDEWYLLAEQELPLEETYDDYLQLENGVGMLRLMETEILHAIESLKGDKRERQLALVTGQSAYSHICKWVSWIQEKYSNLHVTVYPIVNEFFGKNITVSGLLTGQDIVHQLKNRPLGTRLLLPENVLRSGEEVFLDDYTLEEVKEKLQVPIDMVKNNGEDFVKKLLY